MRAILTLRDGFSCRDGRGWYVDGAGGTRSLPWPWPTTLRSAVCSALGRQREAASGETLTSSEWLALKAAVQLDAAIALRPGVPGQPGPRDRMWPAPVDTVCLLDRDGAPRVYRTRWEAPTSDVYVTGGTALHPGGGDVAAALHLATLPEGAVGKPAAAPPWWSEEELVTWLRGEVPALPGAGDEQARRTRRALLSGRTVPERHETHVAINPESGTADDGQLWSSTHREGLGLSDTGARAAQWQIAVQAELLDDAATTTSPSTVLLGGERRIVPAAEASAELFSMPEAFASSLDASGYEELRLLAVTPIYFPYDGWHPPVIEQTSKRVVVQGPDIDGAPTEVELVGASMDRPAPISGWALDGGGGGGQPRATRYVVPPGAVFTVRTRAPNGRFTASQVRALWLAPWGEAREDGLGRVVAGISPQ